MKKILILYASYGSGHLAAAKSLKTYLEENYTNLNIEMVDCIEYINKSLSKVTSTAYNKLTQKAPWAWKRIYEHSQKGTLSHISTTSNKFMALKILKLFNEFKPDLVISTHPFATQMTSYLKKKKKINCKLSTVMTDFMSHDQWLIRHEFSDFFFVSNFNMKQILIKKKISSNKIFVTGIPISKRFLQKFDNEQIYKDLDLDPKLKTILFFGGGTFGLGNENTVNILESLLQIKENIQIVAISGKNQKMKKSFDELAEKYNNKIVKIFEFSNQIPEIMHISSLVITKPGGLTIAESLASELPMIIINPIPGQEEENAEFLENSGVAIWIKNNNNFKKDIQEIFKSPIRLYEMKENAKTISRKNATERICNILINSIN